MSCLVFCSVLCCLASCSVSCLLLVASPSMSRVPSVSFWCVSCCVLCCVLLCCVLFCFLCVPSVSSIYPPGGILNILLRSILCCAFSSMSRVPSVSFWCVYLLCCPVLSCAVLCYIASSVLFVSCVMLPDLMPLSNASHPMRPTLCVCLLCCPVSFVLCLLCSVLLPLCPVCFLHISPWWNYIYISCFVLSCFALSRCFSWFGLQLFDIFEQIRAIRAIRAFRVFPFVPSIRTVRVVRLVPKCSPYCKLSRNYLPESFDWFELVGVWE